LIVNRGSHAGPNPTDPRRTVPTSPAFLGEVTSRTAWMNPNVSEGNGMSPRNPGPLALDDPPEGW